ncbi:zf-C3HC-domain-containing protein [Aureobasidium namibiae CBS 147.97]|uniref:Zf-C3HC-domain-containing protein n=1 Tax=Aureobasidium namibiae CBS 147.97 TaxID=1043004 RepID=A0A074WWZ6_9PEZI
MPEALATTKRKFHKLLDSRFGTPSAPAAATPPRPISQGTIGSEPATKRIRSSDSTASLATSLRTKTVTTKSSINPVRGESNFAPWSHDAFVKRLRSFGPVTMWHPKPDAVGEVEWAKRGWWCVDTNTVGCKGGCGQRLLVKVEPIVKRRRVQEEEGEDEEDRDEEENQQELEQALVDKYRELIVEAHSEDCLWRKAGCKDDIYRLPIVKTTVWQPELRARYQSLLSIAPSLANLTLQPADLTPSPTKILANLPSALLNTAEEENTDQDTEMSEETKQKALQIAISGWRGSTESSTQLLSCSACFQRIGLWMYQPDYKPHRFSTDDDDEDSPQDRSLHLIQLHREHCPWRNSTTQAATGNYAGKCAYEILLDVLDRYIDEQRRRSRGTIQGTVAGEVESDAGVTEDGRESLALETLPSMPELSRTETEKLDRERLSKLRRLKTVLGFKRRAPPAV